MSLAEYNRLMDMASRPPQDPPQAPVAATLARTEVRVRVERESARGVFTIDGEVLRPGLARVTLLSGATLLDATVDGRPVPLLSDGATHAAMLPGPGSFSVAMNWVGSLGASPGRASFTLPVPQSGTARATFDLPGEQADVRLSAGVITRRTAAEGRTIVEATLAPGVATQVSWSMRDSAPVAAARDVRTLGDVLTLVTLGAADLRLVTLLDITVVQGEPRTIAVRLPDGYELANLSGNTLETSEQRDRTLLLTVSDPTARRHQFLLGLERPHEGGSFALTTGLVALPDVQRERGEIAVEGVGTLEATSPEREGLTRIDVRELNPALRRLSRNPVLLAYRYQGSQGAPPDLALQVTRFGDVGVLAAVADRARATTVITSEGRALTEIALLVQNRAQPFLKVTLPAGASIVSVEVAGESAKPALGADGTRIPLLRPGFRPSGPYPVSFVYLHASAPFARKGDLQMQLPKIDVPVGLVEWELFVPDRYRVRQAGGNVLDGNLVTSRPLATTSQTVPQASCTPAGTSAPAGSGALGSLVGDVKDTTGGAMPGVTVEARSPALQEKFRSTVTDSHGRYQIGSLPPGTYCVTFALQGFTTTKVDNVRVSPGGTASARASMRVGALKEVVTVTAEAPTVDVQNARQRQVLTGAEIRDLPSSRDVRELVALVPGVAVDGLTGICAGTDGVFCNPNAQSFNAHSTGAQSGSQSGVMFDGGAVSGSVSGMPSAQQSQNVVNLQRRVAGVLPIRVDVPRAGTSHWFIKPLVVDQEARVTLQYKRK
jgi:hypothetical protein